MCDIVKYVINATPKITPKILGVAPVGTGCLSSSRFHGQDLFISLEKYQNALNQCCSATTK
tara:strand:- start:118 stop:300 length:183 start_codon:yes stop_codon:yes gene_type:complete